MSVSACMEYVSVNEAVGSSYACQEGVEESVRMCKSDRVMAKQTKKNETMKY